MKSICLFTFTYRTEDGKAKIDVESCEVLENRGIKPKDLKRATDAVALYFDE